MKYIMNDFNHKLIKCKVIAMFISTKTNIDNELMIKRWFVSAKSIDRVSLSGGPADTHFSWTHHVIKIGI